MLKMVSAFVLDWLFGDPPNQWHPVAWIGKAISLAERMAPGYATASFPYGVGIVVFGALLVGELARKVEYLPKAVRMFSEPILLKLTISPRGLVSAASEVGAALEAGDLEKARRLTGWHLVSRNTFDLSSEEVAGATVESMAENLTDGFTAPLFYYAIGGLPAAWGYRFVNTCDSMLGYRNEKYEWLGKAPAKIDDFVNWIPARISGFTIVVAAAILGLDAGNALRTMIGQHGKTPSPNAGWTMSAAAGALNVTLSKRGSYTLIGGSGKKDYRTTREAMKLIRVAFLLDLLFCMAVSWVVDWVKRISTGVLLGRSAR